MLKQAPHKFSLLILVAAFVALIAGQGASGLHAAQFGDAVHTYADHVTGDDQAPLENADHDVLCELGLFAQLGIATPDHAAHAYQQTSVAIARPAIAANQIASQVAVWRYKSRAPPA